MVKVIDAIKEAIAAHRHFFALEFFVPVTDAGTQNLYARMERMASFDPLFCAVSWGDRGSTAEASIGIASTGQTLLSVDMQVNITGYTSTPDEIREWLNTLKSRGIQNLCVLRGNPVGPAKDGTVHFPHAVDLVRFIRQEYGAFFGIAVAGYPEGHEESDYEDSLTHLKAKVDAGADLIITQMIFDAAVFLKYCGDCRARGITCPILPGIMPIHSYAQFRNWSRRNPAGAQQIEEQLQPVRNDDSAVKRISVEVTKNLIKTLLRSGVRGVYFFTMNMESVIAQVLEGMDFVDGRRELPWKRSGNEARRKKENVRPIHWAGRTTSYLARTTGWDEFPNGRWTDTQSPAYGEDNTYHTNLLLQTRAKRCPQFLTISSLEDICNIFLHFLEGETALPWSEDLSAEAQMVMDTILRPLNARGLFTINSQPAVNGVSSNNHIVGWGPLNGYVYQKSYLEFFCSLEMSHLVVDTFDKHPSLTYMVTDCKGNLVRTNSKDATSESGEEGSGVTAVTWGVFPNREVLQPTIVSLESFEKWAPEAFELWEAPYLHQGLEAPPIITTVRNNWLLINVVDNEFTVQPQALERAVGEICGKLPPLVATGTPVAGPSPVTAAGSKKPPYKRGYSMEDIQEIIGKGTKALRE